VKSDSNFTQFHFQSGYIAILLLSLHLLDRLITTGPSKRIPGFEPVLDNRQWALIELLLTH